MSNQQDKPPLWETMYEAAAKASDGYCDADGVDGAAMLRALADWLAPEAEEPELFIPSEFGGSIINADQVAEWKVTQRIRQLLLAEADRAEAGE